MWSTLTLGPMSAPHVVRLYQSAIPSGNAYKVTLLMAHLGLTSDVISLDILATPSETRRPEFLAKNPNGRIPVVELSDGSFLPESNAILCYLADGTHYVPADPLHRARALAWMFFEQYSHEPYVAVLKFWTYWGGLANKTAAELELLRSRGNAALSVMSTHLSSAPWFTGSAYGIADIALFAYSQSAAAIGLTVPSPVASWLDRVRDQPGWIPIPSP
jgi:glutathione S-transferase